MSKILKQVTTDGVEFFTKEDTGESGMSQSGLAILCGVGQNAISQLIDTVITSSCPEFLKPLQNIDVALITSSSEFNNATILKSEVCALILEWYAFESQRTNDVAKDSFRKFAKKGIDTWIQEITGWSQQKTPVSNIPQHTSVYIRRLENSRDHIIDYQYWGVFQEADWVYLMVEREWGVPVEQFDLLDGSIGRKWSDYRKGKTWAMSLGKYTHVFRDKRPSVICNAFDHKELSYFKEWLDKIYVPVHLPEYLVKKFGRKATRLIYTENGKLSNTILQLTEIKRETKKMILEFQDFLSKRQLLLNIPKE